MIYFATTIALIFLIAVVDGSQDAIDHGKGAEPLRDLWHILKHINRALLIALGAVAVKADWGPVEVKVLIVGMVLIIAKTFVWDWVYYQYRIKLIWCDNKLKVSTGIDWLDKFFGLHH